MRAGDLSVRLDDRSLRAQVAQQQAAVTEAQANLRSAKQEANRGDVLVPQKAMSQESAETRRTAIQTSQAKLDQVTAALDHLQAQLDHTVIRAPAAGTVSAAPVRLGAVTRAGTELARIIRDGRLEAQVKVLERDLGRIKAGQNVTVTLPDGGTVAAGYQVRVALAKQSAASQAQTVALTEKQFAAGASSGADVAKVPALSMEADIPALESSYAQAVHRLGVLLRVGPETVLGEMARPPPLPLPKFAVAVGIPADMIRSRPGVRQAERQLAEQTAAIGVAEANLYPDVTLSGSLGVSAFIIGDISQASLRTWSFGPSVSAPIFDASKRRAAVTTQQAVRDQVLRRLQGRGAVSNGRRPERAACGR